jgi:hypothetical protein
MYHNVVQISQCSACIIMQFIHHIAVHVSQCIVVHHMYYHAVSVYTTVCTAVRVNITPLQNMYIYTQWYMYHNVRSVNTALW